MITALGALSLLEFATDKSPEASELRDDSFVYAKTGLRGQTTLGVMNTADAEFAGDVLQQAGILELIPAIFSAGDTCFGVTLRGVVLGVLTDGESDDTVKIRGFISWVEDFFAVVGVWHLLYAPAFALLVILGFFESLYLIRNYYEGKLEDLKTPCEECGERTYSFASACHRCGAKREQPNTNGFLGGVKDEKTTSVEDQKLRLMRQKRSPLSGERFEAKGVELRC